MAINRRNQSPLRFRLAIAKFASHDEEFHNRDNREYSCVGALKNAMKFIHAMTYVAIRHNRPYWRTLSRWDSFKALTKAEKNSLEKSKAGWYGE